MQAYATGLEEQLKAKTEQVAVAAEAAAEQAAAEAAEVAALETQLETAEYNLNVADSRLAQIGNQLLAAKAAAGFSEWPEGDTVNLRAAARDMGLSEKQTAQAIQGGIASILGLRRIEKNSRGTGLDRDDIEPAAAPPIVPPAPLAESNGNGHFGNGHSAALAVKRGRRAPAAELAPAVYHRRRKPAVYAPVAAVEAALSIRSQLLGR